MGAPATEGLRELERLLVRAADSGELLTMPAMCDELAIGPQDVAEMLDALRKHGKAIEDTPGEWRAPQQDELEPPPAVGSTPDGRVRVSVADDEPDDEPEDLPHGYGQTMTFGATVRLTAGVAAALDAPALGAIVKAGITEAQENGVPFVLEVLT